jgi:hypothetical protein
MCAVDPSLPETVTERSAPSVPTPANTVTFRRFSRPDSPWNSMSTTDDLRAMAVGTSSEGAVEATPKVDDSATVRKTWAVSSSSLAGMQPRCRQVPPALSFSTIAIRRPADAP